MTLAERLAATGINLNQEVGFIIEGYDQLGTWRAIFARVGKVCTDIPTHAAGKKEAEDFDPEHSLALVWQLGEKPEVMILHRPDNSDLYALDGGGLLIDAETSRISLGQDKKFMASACKIWRDATGENLN